MANLYDKIIMKGTTLVSITDFRMNYADGVSSQAIDYAIKHGLVDYIQVTPRIRVIVLTDVSLSYIPNVSPKRTKSVMHA